MTIGIYALYWEEQDLVYIGQSQNIENRFKEHLRKMTKGSHTNYKVQNTYNLYGEPRLIILEECLLEECNKQEILWTNEFDSINNGLNIVEAGLVGWGVNSNASKYTKWQILKVFSLLANKQDYTQLDISNRTGVAVSTIRDIAGNKTHLWLNDLRPSYRTLILLREPLKATIGRIQNKCITFVSPEGIEHKNIIDISVFARSIEITGVLEDSKIRGFARLADKSRKSYRKWTIRD